MLTILIWKIKKKIPEEKALKFWELLGVIFIAVIGNWSP